MTAITSIDPVIIIGKGPVGSWIAHEFITAGREVAFIPRKDSQHFHGANHTWTLRHGSHEIKRTAPQHANLADEAGTARNRLIVVATRANDLASVWESHLSRLPVGKLTDDGPVILVCCNGWVADMVRAWAIARPDLTFRIAITTAGVARTNANDFVRSDQTGKIWWGPIASHDETTRPSETGFPAVFEWDAHIIERARRKWLFNSAANTLAGLFRLPRNELLLHEHRNHLRELFDEAVDLGCVMWPEWRLDHNRNPAQRENLWRELCELIRATAANENSMSRAAKTGEGTAEALYLGGLAFGHPGYPELKKATRKLLQGNSDNKD